MKKTISATEFIKSIRSNKVMPKKLFIYGKEKYLTRQILNAVSKMFSIETFYADEIDSLYTFTGSSLFNVKPSIAVLLNVEKLPSILRAKAEKERFYSFISKLEGIVFVSYANLERKQLRTEILSRIADMCESIVVARPLSERKLTSILAKKFSSNEREVKSEDIKLIVSMVGNDLTELKLETEKLLSYPNSINREVINKLVVPRASINVFDIILKLLRNEKRGYLNALADAISMGRNPLSLIALFQTQLRQLISIKLGKKVGLPPNIVKNYSNMIAEIPVERLYKLLFYLHEAEFNTKMGKLTGEKSLINLAFKEV